MDRPHLNILLKYDTEGRQKNALRCIYVTTVKMLISV